MLHSFRFLFRGVFIKAIYCCILFVAALTVIAVLDHVHNPFTFVSVEKHVSKPEQSTYLCPSFQGGLGNLMFIYASVYGIAKRKGIKLLLNKGDTLNAVFPGLKAVKLKDTSVCKTAKLVKEKKTCSYNEMTLNFSTQTHTRLYGFLQSFKYFEHVEKEIREQFTFTSLVQKRAQNIIKNSIAVYLKRTGVSNDLQIIGVHIRRGDKLQPGDIKYGFQVATKEYLESAFNYFRRRYTRCLFLVVTSPKKEDIKWRNENIHGEDVMFLSAYAREIDMCVLSMCNHVIFTVGTFGWWAAWLANGTTIYYKNHVRPSSEVRNEYSLDMTDYFPRNWVPLT